jgi:hypothetical protein
VVGWVISDSENLMQQIIRPHPKASYFRRTALFVRLADDPRLLPHPGWGADLGSATRADGLHDVAEGVLRAVEASDHDCSPDLPELTRSVNPRNGGR